MWLPLPLFQNDQVQYCVCVWPPHVDHGLTSALHDTGKGLQEHSATHGQLLDEGKNKAFVKCKILSIETYPKWVHTHAHAHAGTYAHKHSIYTKLILQDPVQCVVVTVVSISARPRHVQLVTLGKMAGRGRVWCFWPAVHSAQLWHHEDRHRHTAAQSLVHGSAQMVPRGSSQSHPGITSLSLGITRCCTFCSECGRCCFQCFILSWTCWRQIREWQAETLKTAATVSTAECTKSLSSNHPGVVEHPTGVAAVSYPILGVQMSVKLWLTHMGDHTWYWTSSFSKWPHADRSNGRSRITFY